MTQQFDWNENLIIELVCGRTWLYYWARVQPWTLPDEAVLNLHNNRVSYLIDRWEPGQTFFFGKAQLCFVMSRTDLCDRIKSSWRPQRSQRLCFASNAFWPNTFERRRDPSAWQDVLSAERQRSFWLIALYKSRVSAYSFCRGAKSVSGIVSWLVQK